MMKSGIPLVQSFEIVGGRASKTRQCENWLAKFATTWRLVIILRIAYVNTHVISMICSGNLVDAGEQSGALETMLDRLATYKEKSEALKAKIKKAMNYPIAVVCVALVVTGILLVKVVPQFATTFSSFGAELPAFTQFVLGLSDLAISHWWKVLIAVGVGGLCIQRSQAPFANFCRHGR